MTLLFVLFALSLQAPQKDNGPANRAQPASQYQRGTDSLPVSVKLLNTGEDEESAQQNAKRILEEQTNARSNLILTGALVIATILSLGVLGYQSYWLKRSVTHAEKATRIDLRAYISASEVNLRPPTARIAVTNVGKTPAHNIKMWQHVYHGPKSWWNPRLKGEPTESKLTLAPGGRIVQNNAIPALTAEDQARIDTGDTAMIYLHGHVAYTDVFGNSWDTEYCYGVEVSALEHSRFIPLIGEYNKAT